MDEAKRKPVMIGIIVVCLALAAYITYRSSGQGSGPRRIEIPQDAMIWVKCVNTRCNAAYEMSAIAYDEFQREHLSEDETPPMSCEKCGKASAFEAMKCPKCGNVFISGESGPQDFSDRCPKCKFSAIEEAKNKEQPSKPLLEE